IGASLEGELPCEQNVLAGVRRPVLDQHRLFGNSYPSRNPGEFLRLGLVPHSAGEVAEAARENEKRGKALEVERRPALRDSKIVAALDQNHVGEADLVVQVMIFPQGSGEATDFAGHRHQTSVAFSTGPDEYGAGAANPGLVTMARTVGLRRVFRRIG